MTLVFAMDIKDLIANEPKKTEEERLESARIEHEIEAEFLARKQRESTTQIHRQELVRQIHGLIKPVLEEFVNSVNQVTRNKLKMRSIPWSAPEETKPHFSYEITQARKSGVKWYGLFEMKLDYELVKSSLAHPIPFSILAVSAIVRSTPKKIYQIFKSRSLRI